MIHNMKLLLLLFVGVQSSVFIEEPSAAVVAVNDVAEFRCRISNGSQSWAINGTSPSILDVEQTSAPASDGGVAVNTLRIVARRAYNGTTVQCLALTFSSDHYSSQTALLQIQGYLSAVPTLVATPLAGSILFNWAAPFSLNLTNTEPDITYCVDVYNSTGERTELVAGGCALTETQYSFTADVTSPCDTFTAVVTPVNRAGNGTASQPVTGTFFSAPVINSSPMANVSVADRETVCVSVNSISVDSVCAAQVHLISEDRIIPAITYDFNFVNTGQRTLAISLDTSDVPLNRIYSLGMLLLNSNGSQNISSIRLSTHDVQGLFVSPQTQSIRVTFAINSEALGFVVIITNGTLEVVYIKYREDDTTVDSFLVPVTGQQVAHYDVSAYDLERSGLPGRHAAASATLNLMDLQQLQQSTAAVILSKGETFSPKSGNFCVNCPASADVTECLVILHPVGNLSDLRSLIVMNDGSNCTNLSSTNNYTYATFGRNLNIVVMTDIKVTVISSNGSSLSPLLWISTLALMPCILLCIVVAILYIKRKNKRTNQLTRPLRLEHGSLPPSNNIQLTSVQPSSKASGQLPEQLPSQTSVQPSCQASGQLPERLPSQTSVQPSSQASGQLSEQLSNQASGQTSSQTPKQSRDSSTSHHQDTMAHYHAHGNTVPVSTACVNVTEPPPPGQMKAKTFAQVSSNKRIDDKPATVKTRLSDGLMKQGGDNADLDLEDSVPLDGAIGIGPQKHVTSLSFSTPIGIVKSRTDQASILPPKLTEELLFKQLEGLKAKWQDVGQQLGLDYDTELMLICEAEATDDVYLKEVIRFWFKNRDFQHTWLEVVTAVEAIGEHSLADDIDRNYVVHSGLPNAPLHNPSQTFERHTVFPSDACYSDLEENGSMTS